MHVWLCQRMTDGDHGRDICAGDSSGAAKVLNEEARNILPGNASLKEVVHLRKAEIQPSIKQLKILRNLICVAGIAGGFVLWTFLPDSHQSEIHTEDPEERARLEEERARKQATRQVFTALGLALAIWAVMGLAALTL